MASDERSKRHLGLFGATALGVGAIVGGGILALAGVAFATAGPGAIVAFALNGIIAGITVASFARLSRRFPESGGIYTYAKRVLSIQVAFMVGWVVWFASIVAGVLYALGFAAFTLEGIRRLLPAAGEPWAFIVDGQGEVILAMGAIAFYTWMLTARTSGGGNAATIGKVFVFALLIGGAAWAWLAGDSGEITQHFSPFAPAGMLGILQAMGYTFIALQGFDLIAAVGGEVKNPRRVMPLAMYLSLGLALVIYIPLLVAIVAVGASEDGILSMAASNPEGLIAEAAENYMGVTGYWLVIGAGLLSMLSALYANLYGASRVAFAMARDRTLPRQVGQIRSTTGTPAIAALATGAMMVIIVIAVGNVAASGAAASLIFLLSFAMVHCIVILARRREGKLRISLLPGVGTLLCLGLAVFQAIVVPEAGRVAVLWLAVGIALYLMALAPGARLADASAEALDPDLAKTRGRSPLVLVPVANPASAASMTDVAATVCTPNVGQVLLLSVMRHERLKDSSTILDAKEILAESVQRGFDRSIHPETLFTVAKDVWGEISRVANEHRCETVMIGLPKITKQKVEAHLNRLISNIDADIVIVRAPPRWHIGEAKRVLVPLQGHRVHSRLRARLIASLSRVSPPLINFLHVLPKHTEADSGRRIERIIKRIARDEATGQHLVDIEFVEDPAKHIASRADASDLLVMGMESRRRNEPSIGPFALEVIRRTTVPLILLGCRSHLTSFNARGIVRAVSSIQKPGRSTQSAKH